MAQIKYADPGDFVHQVDFYDQPSEPVDGGKPQPVRVAANVFCKIESLWNTTQAKRLTQQVLTESTHRVTMRYMAGIKPSMFILYHHPDNGDIQLDIEQVIDPDFMRQELQILATIRNNGQ